MILLLFFPSHHVHPNAPSPASDLLSLLACGMYYTYNILMFINAIYTLPWMLCFLIFHSIEQYIVPY